MIVQFLNQAFNKGIRLLEHALDVRSEKHRAITANLANQETPMYKAIEVNFKRAIKDAAGGPSHAPMAATHVNHFSLGTQLSRTDGRHIPGMATASNPTSYTTESKEKTTRIDGNNVNAEQDLARLAENSLMYNATVQITGGKLSSLKNTIRDLR